jgi:hypothetical protein
MTALPDFAWPRWQDGARRLERDSGLKHRPISEGSDRLIGDDPFAQDRCGAASGAPLWIWTACALALARARISPTAIPQSALSVAAALAGLCAGGRRYWRTRLIRAFDSGAGAAATWMPGSIRRPIPACRRSIWRMGDDGVIAVPQGSVLNLRVHGAPHAPGVARGNGSPPRFTGEDGEYSSKLTCRRAYPGARQVGGHAIGNWNCGHCPMWPR